MKYLNIITGETTLPTQLNGRQNCTWENSRAELSAAGWREHYPSETPNIKTSHWDDTGTAYTEIVDAVWSAEELAQIAADAAAAAAQAALTAAMPAQFATGVAVPIPDQAGAWMLLQPVADGEPIVALAVSASPIDPVDWATRKAARLAAYEARKTARDAVRLDVAAQAGQAESGANGAGNSIPLLRAEVARLAAAVKALTEGGME